VCVHRRPLTTIIFAILLTQSWVETVSRAADATKTAPASKPADDADDSRIDFIYLAGDRPVLIRVRLEVDGKGFRRAWRDHIQTIFDRHDKNSDGLLTSDEIKKFSNDGLSGEDSMLAELFASHRTRATDQFLDRHTDVIRTVTFSSNGRWLASGSDDTTIKLWDAKTGALEATLNGHENEVRGVVFSPDDKTIASGSRDGTLKLWDVDGRSLKATLSGHDGPVTFVAFDPSGKQLASSSIDETIRIWDVENENSVRTLLGHTDYVWSLAFSPDGRTLVSASDDGTVRVWDVASGVERFTLTGHDKQVWSVAVSPDGTSIASGGPDGTVRLWNLANGRLRSVLRGHESAVRSVAFSPDGNRLASASWDETIRLWDVSSRKAVHVINGHTEYVHTALFSPDGKNLASGSEDRTLRYWDVESGKEKEFLRVGAVNARQLGRLFRRERLGPFQSRLFPSRDIVNTATGQNESQGSVTSQLIGRIDEDEDGRLSAEELEVAYGSLLKLDTNDDETITFNELLEVQKPFDDRENPDQANSLFLDPIFPVPSGGLEENTVRSLLKHYDRLEPIPEGAAPGEVKLRPSELAIGETLFEQYDADGDGQFDVNELGTFLSTTQPSYEFTVRVGDLQGGGPRVELVSSSESDGGTAHNDEENNTTAIVIGSVQLDVDVAASDATGSRVRDTYLQQFKATDADNNGYLDPLETQNNVFFQNVFALIDRDKDEKLFERELIAFIDERVESSRSRTVLSILDQGHNLFDILDINGDRRLGQREFAMAIGRLKMWDENGDGQLAQSEIPRHFRLSFGPEGLGLPGTQAAAAAPAATNRGTTVPVSGPVWFQKMDRNRDGDVSRREFLGRLADFDRIDANGDGLIESQEAQAASDANEKGKE